MKRAFSLVELVIVVALLGILAAIVVPQFQSHTTEAKEATAKNNLHILRGAIELYAAQHNDVPPGYPDDDPSRTPGDKPFYDQIIKNGSYMSERPENPFNNIALIDVLDNNEDFPLAPVNTDSYGWIYKPATREIKLNWPGTDSKGIAYFDY
jgi:general secretion pathway protein G